MEGGEDLWVAADDARVVWVGIDKKRGGWGLNNLVVKCYSGYIYAEEPRSFEWEGMAYEVAEFIRTWQEPGERHFLVKTRDNKLFQLCYNEAEERWSLIG